MLRRMDIEEFSIHALEKFSEKEYGNDLWNKLICYFPLFQAMIT